MKAFIITLIFFLITTFFYSKLFNDREPWKIRRYFRIIFIFFINLLFNYYIDNNYHLNILLLLFTSITTTTIIQRLFNKPSKDYSISVKNILKYVMLSISLSFILEIFIFNFRHFESLSYNEIDLTEKITLEDSIKLDESVFTVEEKTNYYMEITDINTEIKNINIDLENILDNEEIFEIKLSITDEANSQYLNIPSFKYSPQVKSSYIHHLYLSGKSSKLLLNINLSDNGLYKINKISINKKVPLNIEYLRISIVSLIIILCLLFRPKSNIYQIKAIEYKRTMPIILSFVFVEMFIFFILVNLNPAFYKAPEIHHEEYNMLAEALSKGKINIDFPVNNILNNMENPYDTNARNSLGLVENVDYLWDGSFYQGKYYVYFGIIPAITMYLPYYLIKGEYLSNQVVIAIIGILAMLSSIYLIYQIIKKYFKETSVGLFIIISQLFISASGMIYIMIRPDLYSVPIIYSLLLTSFGLSMWISSYNNSKKSLNIFKLFIGSLSMALVAGCRPQFLLGSFFILPLFYKYFFKEKWSSRKRIELTCLLTPYLIVAIPLMIYNYARFGSIAEFGASYNLTTNDVTKRGVVFARIFSGLYYYLICPTATSLVFPFIKGINVENTYLGSTISETMLGGFFYNNLICILCLFIYKFKKEFKEKSLYYISLLSVLFGFIVVIFNTEMAGILPRYYTDFSWFFLLATMLIILTLNEKLKNKKWFKQALIIFATIAILTNFSFIFVETDFSISETVPLLYEKIKYLITFWY